MSAQSSGTPIRVLIVDDHRMFSQALELLLRGEDGIQVVGSAATGEEALEMCASMEVDVALVDIDLPGIDGVAVTAHLRERHPVVRVVVITAFQAPNVMARAVKAGASGYVMKTDLADTLVGAITMAMSGNMVLPAGRLAPPISALGRWDVGAPTAAGSPPPSPAERPSGPLTDREVEILQAIANGRSTQDMAAALEITEHTVRSHVKRIFTKLGVHSKAEAVTKGVRLGLISTDPEVEQ
ncbi:MAG TPA: response regulator transcription factor [Actinomycetota bacterium]